METRWAGAAALAAVVGLALGGCGIDKAGERARQRNTIGAVEIATTFCTSGDADLAAHSCAPFSSEHRGQALVSYRVPQGSSAPDGFDDDGGLLHFRADAGLAAYMQASQPEDGMRWVAYVSGVQSPVPRIGHAFVVSPEFSLPAGSARPYPGPFPYRVVGGWRELPDTADDGSAPIDCSDTGHTSCTETGVDGDDSLASVRDLAVLPGGDPPAVAPGAHVRVPFDLRLAGAGGDGVRFGLSASTDLSGASVALDADSVAPGGDSVTPVAVDVTVPAGAPAGTYRVDLDAVAPGDGDVIIRRVRAKAGAVGALEHRTGSMTFRVVDPPPPPPHDPDPDPGPREAPPPPAVVPPAVVPPAVVPPAGPVSGPPTVRPHVARRARLRLSLSAVPRRAYGGDYASYLLMVSNTAREPAARTRVCERLPARVQFVGATRRVRLTGRSLCFAGGRLGAGRSLAALVYVHVDTDARPGMARARATATAANADRVRAAARLRVLRRATRPHRAPVTG
jgi:hypothetical protein